MSTQLISRAALGVLLLSAALSNPAQARPSDPGWRPVSTTPTSSAQEAVVSSPQRWYGPRGTIPLSSGGGYAPVAAIQPVRWIGPRNTIPTAK